MKKQGNGMKKITSVLLSLAILMGSVSFPQFTTAAKAQEPNSVIMDELQEAQLSASPTSSPTPTEEPYPETETVAFAEKSELVKADKFTLYSDETHTGVAQRVNFGKNKAWYIAGAQNDGKELVLICDPRYSFGNTIFSSRTDNYKYTYDGESDWGTYVAPTESVPNEIGINHYGASEIRQNLRALYGNDKLDIFTSAEQALMKEVKVYTEDIKNDGLYYTSDKLYLAYGMIPTGLDLSTYITVGSNATDRKSVV